MAKTPPPPHRHTSSCYKTTLLCAKVVHTHNGRACFKSDGTLKCGTGEHTHVSGCYGPTGPFCGFP